jgi:alpha-galactosidase
MTKTRSVISVVIVAASLAGARCTARSDRSAEDVKPVAGGLPHIQSLNLRVEFDKNMRSRVVARFHDKEVSLGPFSASETVKDNEEAWYNFALTSQSHERVTDTYGAGEKLTLNGTSGVLRKSVSVIIYDEFPNLAVFDVSYTNTGKSQLKILEWNNNAYTIDAQPGPQVPFWSFQSGSYEQRPNWLVPLHAGFSQENYHRYERQRLRWRHADC